MASTERQKLSTKIPNLMLGRGKITRDEDADKIELHLSPKDYTSLVTQRTHPHDVFSVIATDRNKRKPKQKKKDEQTDRGGSAVVLPKTYITRSGSLLLYSDSKIMKDNAETIQQDLDRVQQGLAVQGQAVSRQTKTREAGVPSWGSLLIPRSPSAPVTTCDKLAMRERISYLGLRDGVRRPRRVPYAWNYAVTPLKLIKVTNNTDLKTVHALSEAILTYNQGVPTGAERYANVMCNSWGSGDQTSDQRGKTSSGNKGNVALSNWTRSWLNNEDLGELKGGQSISTSGGSRDPDMLALERARTNLSRQSTIYNRVPVNTPMSSVRTAPQGVRTAPQSVRTAPQTRGKVDTRRRVKSSITTSHNIIREQRTQTSCSGFSEDGTKRLS